LNDDDDDDDVIVYITSAMPSEIASKVNGYFTFRGEKIRFKAIAFGRIGGHNVNVKISKKNEERLRKMGVNPEEVIIKVQRKMVLGEMVMPERKSDV
jgi:Fe2+ transport system protein FeoA